MSSSLPETAVPVATVVAGVVGVLVAGVVGWLFAAPPWLMWLMLMGLSGLPMWCLEFVRHSPLRPGDSETGTQPTSRNALGSFTVVGLFVASIELQLLFDGPQVAGLAAIKLPLVLALGACAVMLLLVRDRETAKVGGCVMALLRGEWPSRDLAQAFLGWCVKAFFLPLMIAWSYGWLVNARADAHSWKDGYKLYLMVMAGLYAIDTAFGTIGYMSTSRRLGAHIRSVDSTLLGWGSALVCYPPLNTWVIGVWLAYKSSKDWHDWFADVPWLAVAWGALIVLFTAVYVYATVVFGPRFSNLTNRGIITIGPYRWSKHPAYISKNASWWLISVPFLSSAGVAEAVSHSAALLGLNGIYWLRAWTEERHLRADPVYVQYADWIERNGLLARVKKVLSCG